MEVSPTSVFLLPVVFSLTVLFMCWMYYALIRPVRPRPRQRHLYQCRLCRRVYLDERDVPLARCPRCGCLNEAVKQ